MLTKAGLVAANLVRPTARWDASFLSAGRRIAGSPVTTRLLPSVGWDFGQYAVRAVVCTQDVRGLNSIAIDAANVVADAAFYLVRSSFRGEIGHLNSVAEYRRLKAFA